MAAKKKKTGKSIALPWQQALAKHAKEGKAPKEKASGGDYISIKGGKFSISGTKIGLNGKGQELDCVVLGWVFEKCYYDGDYVEGEKTSPACFAIGYDEDELIPNETSPAIQNETCEDCEHNAWGSGQGKGKDCGDRRRLALAMEEADGSIGIKMLNIPPTSLKNWKAFVNAVDAQGLHTMQCAVSISFDDEYVGSGLPPLVFDIVSELTKDKQLQAMADKLDEATKMLEQPYDVSNYHKPKGKKGKKKASKKKSKKKASKKKSKKKRSKFS